MVLSHYDTTERSSKVVRHNSQAMNRYSYLSNFPLSATDPSGFGCGHILDVVENQRCRDREFANDLARWDLLRRGGPVSIERDACGQFGDMYLCLTGGRGVVVPASEFAMAPRVTPQGEDFIGTADWIVANCAMALCHGTLIAPHTKGEMTAAERSVLNELALTVGTLPISGTMSTIVNSGRALMLAHRGERIGAVAYHYTFEKWLSSIRVHGLKKGTYATPNGTLTPLQAHIDLALPPNRGLPDVVIRIDLAGLRNAGFEIPQFTRVGRHHNMPGGAFEIEFTYPVPPEFVTILGP